MHNPKRFLEKRYQIVLSNVIQNSEVLKFNLNLSSDSFQMKMRFYFKSIQILRILRIFVMMAGVLFLGAFVVSMTTLPYWGVHWLGTSKSELKEAPSLVIFLGGGGMPSESNLIRCWFTAFAAKSFPHSSVVIVMPGDTTDNGSTPSRIEAELILRGVEKERCRFVNWGTNTRSQALACAGAFDADTPVLLVTSPENMRRSVLCFKKAGFGHVGALPAFENAAEADFTFIDDDLGGNSPVIPDVGHNMQVRYQIWTHLKYEILICREFLALAYYQIRGWI